MQARNSDGLTVTVRTQGDGVVSAQFAAVSEVLGPASAAPNNRIELRSLSHVTH